MKITWAPLIKKSSKVVAISHHNDALLSPYFTFLEKLDAYSSLEGPIERLNGLKRHISKLYHCRWKFPRKKITCYRKSAWNLAYNSLMNLIFVELQNQRIIRNWMSQCSHNMDKQKQLNSMSRGEESGTNMEQLQRTTKIKNTFED